MRDELKNLNEVDKEFMTKVLSRLEIQDEDNAIQYEKLGTLDVIETDLEELKEEVLEQAEILNDTRVALGVQFQRQEILESNLTQILENNEGQEDQDEEESDEDSNSMEESLPDDSKTEIVIDSSDTQISSAQGVLFLGIFISFTYYFFFKNIRIHTYLLLT